MVFLDRVLFRASSESPRPPELKYLVFLHFDLKQKDVSMPQIVVGKIVGKDNKYQELKFKPEASLWDGPLEKGSNMTVEEGRFLFVLDETFAKITELINNDQTIVNRFSPQGKEVWDTYDNRTMTPSQSFRQELLKRDINIDVDESLKGFMQSPEKPPLEPRELSFGEGPDFPPDLQMAASPGPITDDMMDAAFEEMQK